MKSLQHFGAALTLGAAATFGIEGNAEASPEPTRVTMHTEDLHQKIRELFPSLEKRIATVEKDLKAMRAMKEAVIKERNQLFKLTAHFAECKEDDLDTEVFRHVMDRIKDEQPKGVSVTIDTDEGTVTFNRHPISVYAMMERKKLNKPESVQDMTLEKIDQLQRRLIDLEVEINNALHYLLYLQQKQNKKWESHGSPKIRQVPQEKEQEKPRKNMSELSGGIPV